jgi:hypothetical protein
MTKAISTLDASLFIGSSIHSSDYLEGLASIEMEKELITASLC